MSLDYLCRWQVLVSVYCAWRIPAHLKCTQCSILLYLMDSCFLTCICLWQISQIQTRLFKVVGPGLVSTSAAFVSSSASHPAGPHAQKTVNREGSTQFAQQLVSVATAPPLVGCVVWSLYHKVTTSIRHIPQQPTTQQSHKHHTLILHHSPEQPVVPWTHSE